MKYFQAVAGGFSGSDGLAQIAQGNPLEPMMEKLLLRAVTHAVSEMTIDEAWPKTDLLEREVSGKLRDSVKTLDLGIDIASLEVRVMQLTPALQTRQAFLAVSKALDERQGIVQQAEGYRNKTLNDADAEALRIVSEAQGAADELKAAVDADATRFAELYPQYLENPILLRKKLYEDALDRVFQQVDEFFLVDDQNGRELRLMLDRQKKKKDQDKIYNYYVVKNKKMPEEFNFHFHVLSIQRLLKILGIFLRLYRRDKKKKYLKYLTRTWKLVELRLNHQKLKDLNELFNKYFTKDIRKKKWI